TARGGAMLGPQERRDRRGLKADRVRLLGARVPVLTEDTALGRHGARPVLRIDDDDTTRADRHMVDVRELPARLPHVVQERPAVAFERAERVRDEPLALRALRPRTLLLERPLELRLRGRIRLVAQLLL